MSLIITLENEAGAFDACVVQTEWFLSFFCVQFVFLGVFCSLLFSCCHYIVSYWWRAVTFFAAQASPTSTGTCYSLAFNPKTGIQEVDRQGFDARAVRLHESPSIRYNLVSSAPKNKK